MITFAVVSISGPQHDQRHQRDARDRVEERDVDAERDIEHPEPRQQQPRRDADHRGGGRDPAPAPRGSARDRSTTPRSRSWSTAADATALGVVNRTGSMRAPTICQMASTVASEASRMAISETAGAAGAPPRLSGRGCDRPRPRRAQPPDREPARLIRPPPRARGPAAPYATAARYAARKLGEPRIGADRLDIARPAERDVEHFLDAARPRASSRRCDRRARSPRRSNG